MSDYEGRLVQIGRRTFMIPMNMAQNHIVNICYGIKIPGFQAIDYIWRGVDRLTSGDMSLHSRRVSLVLWIPNGSEPSQENWFRI